MIKSKDIEYWLLTKDWFESYMLNLYSQCKLEGLSLRDEQKRVKSYLNGLNYYDTITKAFYWGNTPEGYEFWEKKNEIFIKFIKGIENKERRDRIFQIAFNIFGIILILVLLFLVIALTYYTIIEI